MDNTTVSRTKSVLNAMLEMQQTWIDYAPDYDIPDDEREKLQKKLKKAIDNLEKVSKSLESKSSAR